MAACGFTSARVNFHAILCSVLEQEFFKDVLHPRTLSGSYAEGWGYNLSCINGIVAIDSDVDFTFRITRLNRTVYHFPFCYCTVEDKHVTSILRNSGMGEGHVQLYYGQRIDISPALSADPQSCRPATDECGAYMLECMPPQCNIFSQRKLPKEILQKCQDVGVHLVQCQRRNQPSELRVSYSFMEKVVMRNLPEQIGRCFLFIKFIFKKKIPKLGLKSYMAKTLMFYLVSETQHCVIPPGSVIQLAARALHILVHFLRTFQPYRSEVCMPHFYQDAPIFFKRSSKLVKKQYLIEKIECEIAHIEERMNEYCDYELTPVQTPGFYFCQPRVFYIHSKTQGSLKMNDEGLKGFRYYDKSKPALADSEMQPGLFYTEKLCAKVIQHLIECNKEAARSLLRSTLHVHVEPLVFQDSGCDADIEFYLRNHFTNADSLWIFPLESYRYEEMMRRLNLNPETAELFPSWLFPKDNYMTIINFKALLNYFRRVMLGDEFTEERWFQELQKWPFPDFQEFALFADTCKSLNNLNWAWVILQKLPYNKLWEKDALERIENKLQKLSVVSDSD